MAIIFNGQSVTRIIKDGVDIDVLKFGNVEVFRKRKLTINFKGGNNAQYGTYPLIVRSTNSPAVEVYGANVTKEIYIPNGDTVYIDLRNYVRYGTARSKPFYEESYFTLNNIDVNPDNNFTDYNGYSFTMDKDIILNPITTGAIMGNLRDVTEGKTYAWVDFSAKSNVTLTNLKAVKL